MIERGARAHQFSDLRHQVEAETKPTMFPTPRAEDAESCGGHNSRQVADSLRAAVTWPTPQASEYKGQSQRGQFSPSDRLTNMVEATDGQPAPDSPSTSGKNPELWYTPEARNQEGYQVVDGKRYPRLGAQVQTWSTPRAQERSQQNSQDNGQALSRQVQWLTPHGFMGQGQDGSYGGGGEFAKQVGQWGSPRVTTNGGSASPQCTGKGSRLEDQVGKRTQKLNPDWVEQLMGLPAGWTAFDCSETELCPPRQKER